MLNVATDFKILNKGKSFPMVDRCLLERATPSDMERLNSQYGFVFPMVSLMECAASKNQYVRRNIKLIEDFLIPSPYNPPRLLSNLLPCEPEAIMKKDLGVSLFVDNAEESHLVYFRPYDVDERMDLLKWAQDGSAMDYYNRFASMAHRFANKHWVRPQEIVASIRAYGISRGERYVPQHEIEQHVHTYIKAFKKRYGYNPFYGNSLVDVLGLVRWSLNHSHMINIIEDLSRVYGFNPSYPLRRIALRPDYPAPDDYAKYTYYFYFVSMCMVYSGLMMEKTYLRDWEYMYYLPFCPLITGDKRFFKPLKAAMDKHQTDRNIGINISERIHIVDKA